MAGRFIRIFRPFFFGTNAYKIRPGEKEYWDQIFEPGFDHGYYPYLNRIHNSYDNIFCLICWVFFMNKTAHFSNQFSGREYGRQRVIQVGRYFHDIHAHDWKIKYPFNQSRLIREIFCSAVCPWFSANSRNNSVLPRVREKVPYLKLQSYTFR